MPIISERWFDLKKHQLVSKLRFPSHGLTNFFMMFWIFFRHIKKVIVLNRPDRSFQFNDLQFIFVENLYKHFQFSVLIIVEIIV